jgi:hypothetical protein
MTEIRPFIPEVKSKSYPALFVFLALAPWWPSQESDQAKINFPKGVDLGVHCVQCFRSTTPAVTKCAC